MIRDELSPERIKEIGLEAMHRERITAKVEAEPAPDALEISPFPRTGKITRKIVTTPTGHTYEVEFFDGVRDETKPRRRWARK